MQVLMSIGHDPLRKIYTQFVWTIEATGGSVATGRMTQNSLFIRSRQLVPRIIISLRQLVAFELPILAFLLFNLSFNASVPPFYFRHIIISPVVVHLLQGVMPLLQRHLLAAAILEKINSTCKGRLHGNAEAVLFHKQNQAIQEQYIHFVVCSGYLLGLWR